MLLSYITQNSNLVVTSQKYATHSPLHVLGDPSPKILGLVVIVKLGIFALRRKSEISRFRFPNRFKLTGIEQRIGLLLVGLDLAMILKPRVKN